MFCLHVVSFATLTFFTVQRPPSRALTTLNCSSPDLLMAWNILRIINFVPTGILTFLYAEDIVKTKKKKHTLFTFRFFSRSLNVSLSAGLHHLSALFPPCSVPLLSHSLLPPPPSKETLPYTNINVPLRIQTLLIPIRIQLLTSIWIRRFTLIRIQLFHTEPYPFFTDPDPFLASVTFIFWHTSMCVFAQFRPPRSLPEKLLANSHSVDRWKSLVHI